MRRRVFAAVLIWASCCQVESALAFAGNVLVVDGQGHGTYTQIQPAVNAAVDGDTILVKAGSYFGFSVAAKGLSITADAGHTVVVTSPVSVVNLSAQSTVLIAGLEVHSNSSLVPTLDVQGNSGSVRIQSCTIQGFTSSCCADGSPAVHIANDLDVALNRCTLQGGAGACSDSHCFTITAAGSALVAQSSQVALYDCILVGGTGGDSLQPTCDSGAGTGGTACVLSDGFLFASNSRIEGGNGGHGSITHSDDCAFPCFPGSGGPGGGCIHVISGSPPLPDVVLFADALTPGAGGVEGYDTGCGYIGNNGHAGIPIVAPTGSVRETSGQGRRLAAPSVTRETHSIPLNLHGEPGEVVWIYFAEKPGYTFDPSLHGVNLTATSPPARLVRLGTLPANGTLDTHIRLPDLGVRSKTFFIQSVFGDPSNNGTLGTPLTLVELDSAF
jgi:hypothetical protein